MTQQSGSRAIETVYQGSWFVSSCLSIMSVMSFWGFRKVCAQRGYRLHSWLLTGQPLMKSLHIDWHSNESLATRAFSTVTCNSHSVLCLFQWPDDSLLYFWLWAWRYSNYPSQFFNLVYFHCAFFVLLDCQPNRSVALPLWPLVFFCKSQSCFARLFSFDGCLSCLAIVFLSLHLRIFDTYVRIENRMNRSNKTHARIVHSKWGNTKIPPRIIRYAKDNGM